MWVEIYLPQDSPRGCFRGATKRSNLNSLSRLSGKLNPAEQGGHFKYNFIQAAYIGFKKQ
jgi:hypothetical protein